MAARRMQGKVRPEWLGERDGGAAAPGDVFRNAPEDSGSNQLPPASAQISPWKVEFDVGASGGGSGNEDVKIVALQNGDFWVVWQESGSAGVASPAGLDILGQRFNALGVAQGSAVRLNNNFSSNDEQGPEVSAEVGGPGFFLAYEVAGSSFQNIYVEKMNADGSANGGGSTILPIVVDPAGTAVSYDKVSIQVASATHGLVTYQQTGAASGNGTYGQFFNPTTMQLIGIAFPVSGAVADVLANGNYLLRALRPPPFRSAQTRSGTASSRWPAAASSLPRLSRARSIPGISISRSSSGPIRPAALPPAARSRTI